MKKKTHVDELGSVVSDEQPKTYDMPPTQYELASLAATLITNYRNLTGFHNPEQINSKMTEAALDLWNEAGKKLQADTDLNRPSRERRKIIERFSEAMLVGKHFMPKIPDAFVILEHCSLDSFLRKVVGLTEKADRMKWFRAFIDAWMEPDINGPHIGINNDGNKIYPSYLYLARRRPAYGSSRNNNMEHSNDPFDSFHSPKPNKQESLEYFRENGIREPASMATAFRSWRMTMKAPEIKAEVPYRIELCIALANSKQKS